MNLYEIRTGGAGLSYERVYIWTLTKKRAEEIFYNEFDQAPDEIKTLFAASALEFITEPSDEGWKDEIWEESIC